MAFFNKAGNILRQAASKHINHEISAAKPSIFQMIRCMSSSKLFVGGLSYNTDDTSLKEAFDKYGQVMEARVILDRETGRSRGFGFVTYTDSEAASAAIQAIDQQELHGRRVRVNYATDRSQGGGGGYGGSGGYGGGGGGYGGGSGGYGGGYGGYGGGGGRGGGGYGGGGDGGYGGSSGSSQNFGADNSSGDQFGSSSGFGNVGDSEGGLSQDAGRLGGNFGDDAQDDYANTKA